VVVVIAATAALTGVKPAGTRHVAHTQLMGIGRIVLALIIAAAFAGAYLAWRGR